jgi:hypothetical protein
LILLFLALAAVPAETDMVAHFKAGQRLCSNPDVAAKTCTTIDRVGAGADGGLVQTGETLVSPNEVISLEMTTPIHFEEGAACGRIDEGDFRRSVVRANGVPIPADRNAKVLDMLWSKVFAAQAGQKICEGLRVEQGQLVKRGQTQQMDLPLPGTPVRWIRADEGYRVAPRSPARP